MGHVPQEWANQTNKSEISCRLLIFSLATHHHSFRICVVAHHAPCRASTTAAAASASAAECMSNSWRRNATRWRRHWWWRDCRWTRWSHYACAWTCNGRFQSWIWQILYDNPIGEAETKIFPQNNYHRTCATAYIWLPSRLTMAAAPSNNFPYDFCSLFVPIWSATVDFPVLFRPVARVRVGFFSASQ